MRMHKLNCTYTSHVHTVLRSYTTLDWRHFHSKTVVNVRATQAIRLLLQQQAIDTPLTVLKWYVIPEHTGYYTG